MSHQNKIETNILLSPYTTLQLGGQAAFFLRAKSSQDIVFALKEAKQRGLPVLVLGGGSNLVLPDEGFDGIVIKIETKGLRFILNTDGMRIKASAGQIWDTLPYESISRGWSGLECLSGIPGLVGAVPIQNIGAYGQEVSQTIESVQCLDRSSLQLKTFRSKECLFSYRSSIFKENAKDEYIVLQVCFLLKKTSLPNPSYPELKHYIEENYAQKLLEKNFLKIIRQSVLCLRRKKGMLIEALEPKDPNTCSAGSFFINPILNLSCMQKLRQKCLTQGIQEPLPCFSAGKDWKISAAWLIEKAGYQKGFRKGRVGISDKHSLALVNYGGSSKELLQLASEIQKNVYSHFGILLAVEPKIIEC